MSLPTQTMLMEAITAARNGERARARDLLTRLLRTDSSNPEYWVWMSSVVESKRERIYCLQSALKLDPHHRAARRGLVLLGARQAEESDLAQAIEVPRSQIAAVATGPASAGGMQIKPNWTWAVAGVFLVFVMLGTFAIFRPRPLAPQPTLPPLPSDTPSPSPTIPIPTDTPIPAVDRVQRTPIPSAFAETPIHFFVPQTPTPTTMLGLRERSSYEAYNSAIRALESADFQAAANFMSQVIDLDDSLADAHYFYAEALRLQSASDLELTTSERRALLVSAIASYDQAVLADPDFAPAYLGRGKALLELTLQSNDPDDLTLDDLPADFESAIERDPSLLEAYLLRADFLDRLRLWNTMEESLLKGLANGLQEPLLLIKLSVAQLRGQKYELALENAIEGSVADPTSLEGYLALGQAYARLEMYDDALWPLTTYVVYRGDDHRGWADLGRAQLEFGDLVSAALSFEQALTINDRYTPAFLGRGLLNLQQEDPQAALADFNRARQFGTETYEILINLGRANLALGNTQEAINNVTAAIELASTLEPAEKRDPKVAAGYALRAQIYTINPNLISEAIRNWEFLLNLEFAPDELVALAQEQLALLRAGTATPSPTDASPTPTGEATRSTPSPGPGTTTTPTPTPSSTTPGSSG